MGKRARQDYAALIERDGEIWRDKDRQQALAQVEECA